MTTDRTAAPPEPSAEEMLDAIEKGLWELGAIQHSDSLEWACGPADFPCMGTAPKMRDAIRAAMQREKESHD